MYIKSSKELSAISQEDLMSYKRKLKVGSKLKIKVVSAMDLEKRDIVNAEITHLYPHFAIVAGKHRGRMITRSIHYVDLYKASKKNNLVQV